MPVRPGASAKCGTENFWIHLHVLFGALSTSFVVVLGVGFLDVLEQGLQIRFSVENLERCGKRVAEMIGLPAAMRE